MFFKYWLARPGSRSPLGLRGLKYKGNDLIYYCSQSQPTRAAWIEIVAESTQSKVKESQPTRAAWIEITARRQCASSFLVAAHSGCVD